MKVVRLPVDECNGDVTPVDDTFRVADHAPNHIIPLLNSRYSLDKHVKELDKEVQRVLGHAADSRLNVEPSHLPIKFAAISPARSLR